MNNDNTVNARKGLPTGGSVRKPISEEARAKRSAAQKAYWADAERSGEARERLHAHVMSEEGRARISAANTGRTRSAETKARISAAGRARAPISEETRARLRARGVSEETRARLRAVATARWIALNGDSVAYRNMDIRVREDVRISMTQRVVYAYVLQEYGSTGHVRSAAREVAAELKLGMRIVGEALQVLESKLYLRYGEQINTRTGYTDSVLIPVALDVMYAEKGGAR